jgi:hypothetical protein
MVKKILIKRLVLFKIIPAEHEDSFLFFDDFTQHVSAELLWFV